MAKPGYMHLGEVPEEIFQQELFKYLQRKEESPDAKRVKAQFSYEGKNYTFQKGRSSSGYQIKHSSERVAKEAKRRGLYHDQAVPLSEIEQKMVDNYYEEAQKRGLQVDHKIPIARGGPSNAPWNLGLMNPADNAAKAERIGGNFKYQPFLADGAIRFPVKGLGGLIPFVGVGFDALDAKEKTERAAKTNAPLDVAQAAIANVTAATAPIPEPVSQSINFVGGTVNFVIDALRMPATPVTDKDLEFDTL